MLRTRLGSSGTTSISRSSCRPPHLSYLLLFGAGHHHHPGYCEESTILLTESARTTRDRRIYILYRSGSYITESARAFGIRCLGRRRRRRGHRNKFRTGRMRCLLCRIALPASQPAIWYTRATVCISSRTERPAIHCVC